MLRDGEEYAPAYTSHEVQDEGEIQVSRSVKKVWAGSIAVCRSKKQDKRIASQTYRVNANRLLRVEGEDYIERSRHEFKYGDNWVWGCDGTAFWGTVRELVAFEENNPRWIHKRLAK